MKMRSLARGLAVCLSIALALAIGGNVYAQANGLQLSLGKIAGIGLTGQIQGYFRLSASGPADVTSVTFEIDGQPMGTASQPPFNLELYTDSYAPGPHRFTATGRTAAGQVLASNTVSAEIVSFSQGWQSAVRLLWPLLLIIAVALGSSIAVPLLSARGGRRYEPGALRDYGISGGTVCSRCKRPYSLSFLSPRLVVGRLARCPYCGKWTIARPASQEVLRAAEQAEVQNQPTVRTVSREEMLKQQIEDSRLSR